MGTKVKRKRTERIGNIIPNLLGKYYQQGSIDIVFLIIVLGLLSLGLIMMFSASYPSAYAEGEASTYYIKKQGFGAAFGLVAMYLFSKIDVDIWKTKFFSYSVAIGSYGLLVLVLILNWNKDIKRWISIGSFGFQPSELSKFAIVLIGALLYAGFYKRMNSSRIYSKGKVGEINLAVYDFFKAKGKNIYLHEGWMPTVYHVAFFITNAGLVALGSHLSAFIIMILLGGAMMFLGGVRKRWFALVLALVVLVVAVVCVPIMVTVHEKNEMLESGELSGSAEADQYVLDNVKIPFIKGYQVSRIISWIDKDYSPRDARWQQNQGLYAVGSGGFFGKGLGNSTLKYLYVSEPHNDMIFTIVCEELGFLGAVVVILGYTFLVYRGMKIGMQARTRFKSYLAMGLTLLLGIQALLNIAVATELIPNTGISLPFFSYGGTALVVHLAEAGIILSVSRDSRIRKIR